MPTTTRWAAVLAALALWLGPAAAEGATGAFFEPDALPRRRYEVVVETGLHRVVRQNFSRPVFLFPQPLERMKATELVTTLDLRLSITNGLAAQARLPLRATWVAAKTRDLQVSTAQTLPGRRHTLSSWGPGDPLLGLAYRLRLGTVASLFADLGTVVPLDDQPGASSFPTRVPLGTGQAAAFAGGGANLRQGVMSAGLDYRYTYFFGDAAKYLVRRVGNQSYSSGSLAPFAQHRVVAQLRARLGHVASVLLTGEWTSTVLPLLKDRETLVRVVPADWMHDLSICAGLRVEITDRHSLELFYRRFVRSAWDVDPFLPIVIPDQGVGVSWHFAGM